MYCRKGVRYKDKITAALGGLHTEGLLTGMFVICIEIQFIGLAIICN